MVHRCCISSCGMNVRVAEAKGLSYHSFPSKEPNREQWIHAIRPHLSKPDSFRIVPGYTRICSRHFRKKDYSLDIKQRARLNSNAVPSVFPRKNTPLVVQSVIPTSPEVAKPKSSAPQLPSPVSTATILGNTVTLTLQSSPGDSEAEIGSMSRELLIESATISDDQLILTILDHDNVNTPNAIEHLEQDEHLSEEQRVLKLQKKRKRRKWNRTAFARPAKGKKKNASGLCDESNIDGVGEALAEISLSTLLSITPDIHEDYENHRNESLLSDCVTPSSNQLVSTLQTMSLPMDDSIPAIVPDQVHHLSSIEQELLQSIQAVSIHCGEPEHESQHIPINHESLSSLTISSDLVAPFVEESSEEESLFDTANGFGSSLIGPPMMMGLENPIPMSSFNLDLRAPTVSEIEQLTQDFNSSLLTTESLTLAAVQSIDSALQIHSDDNDFQSVGGTIASPTPTNPRGAVSSTRPKSGVKSTKSTKPIDSKIIPTIAKKAKRDKLLKGFTIERFRDNDKDIEYYTGFNSYRNFEGFFRSLEAHIEKLKVTDMMYGVANLNHIQQEVCESGEVAEVELSPSTSSEIFDVKVKFEVPPPEEQKKRPYQGRSMSRINEFFMTVMRLKRRLPEKVLGHMFYISQPTVSRIVRAWTMLLSKLITSYPTESNQDKTSKAGCKSITEHNYTSRGLGIPDSFRQLFHSDLANSIVLTAPNARKSTNKSTTGSKRARTNKFVYVDPTIMSSTTIPISSSSAENDNTAGYILPDPEYVCNPCAEVEVVDGEFFNFAY